MPDAPSTVRTATGVAIAATVTAAIIAAVIYGITAGPGNNAIRLVVVNVAVIALVLGALLCSTPSRQ